MNILIKVQAWLIFFIFSLGAFPQQTYTPLNIKPDKIQESTKSEESDKKEAKNDKIKKATNLKLEHRETEYYEFTIAPKDKLKLDFSLPKGKCTAGSYYLDLKDLYSTDFDSGKKLKLIYAISRDECDEYDSHNTINENLTLGPFEETVEVKVTITSDAILIAKKECATVTGATFDKNCNITSMAIDPKDPVPPTPFIDKDPSLGECQSLGEWKVLKDTVLYDKINGSKTDIVLKEGSVVNAVSAESRTTPIPVNIVYDHGVFKKGDRIYILGSLSEGYGRIWHKGKILEEDIMDGIFNNTGYIQECTPSPECWGKAERPKHDLLGKTWIKFELPNSKEGWSKEQDNFRKTTSC